MKYVKKYFDNFIKESMHHTLGRKYKKVFLQRNYKEGKKTYNPKDSFVKNRIAFKVIPAFNDC